MTARLALGSLGVALAAYGGWLLLAEGIGDVVDTAVWLAAGVVLHDFVVVPLTLGVCWLGMRLLPPHCRPPFVAGLVVLGTLTLMAVPVLGGWGANADNPTILDRNYTAGWLVVAAIVVAGVLVGLWFAAKRTRSSGAGRTERTARS
jgi:hypothetical protein